MDSPLELMSRTTGADRPAPDAAGQAGHATSPSGNGRKRVLLVDDEESILASLRRLFRREPYDLITANCSRQALQLLEQNPVQLVITDQRMPGTTGIELLREIRRRWPDTLRIVLSGYSEVSTLIAAINEGEIYKFVTKPWNDEELKLHVRRALEQYELVAENNRLTQEILERNKRLQELNELLDQRANDASTGLTCAQELFEAIDVGVVTIDETDLVVSANQEARRMLCPPGGGCTGLSARIVLPDDLYEQLAGAPLTDAASSTGRLTIRGRTHEWRVRPFVAGNNHRGKVLTLWEVVS